MAYIFAMNFQALFLVIILLIFNGLVIIIKSLFVNIASKQQTEGRIYRD